MVARVVEAAYMGGNESQSRKLCVPDQLDAVWLAKLAERGMLRASFIPARPQRQLRDLTRYRRTLTQAVCGAEPRLRVLAYAGGCR